MDLLLLSLLLSAVPQALSNEPSVTQDCPSVTQDCPSVTQACPSVTQDCPSVTQACPSVKEDCPSVNLDPHQLFQLQHTNNFQVWDDKSCTRFMKQLMKTMGWILCKSPNSVILGDASAKTNLNAVTDVCSTRGGTVIHKNKGVYQSNRAFRVATCTTRDTYEPCTYTGTTEKIQLILTCEGGSPVHYGYPPKKP